MSKIFNQISMFIVVLLSSACAYGANWEGSADKKEDPWPNRGTLCRQGSSPLLGSPHLNRNPLPHSQSPQLIQNRDASHESLEPLRSTLSLPEVHRPFVPGTPLLLPMASSSGDLSRSILGSDVLSSSPLVYEDPTLLPISYAWTLEAFNYSSGFNTPYVPGKATVLTRQPEQKSLKNSYGAPDGKWYAAIIAFRVKYIEAKAKQAKRFRKREDARHHEREGSTNSQHLMSSLVDAQARDNTSLTNAEQGFVEADEALKKVQECGLRDHASFFPPSPEQWAEAVKEFEQALIYNPYCEGFKLGNPYFARPSDLKGEKRVAAFTLEPQDLRVMMTPFVSNKKVTNIFQEKIDRLKEEIARYERLYFIYKQDLAPRFSSSKLSDWTSRTSWTDWMNRDKEEGPLDTVQKTLRSEFPFRSPAQFSRDLISDKGSVLACLHKDELGVILDTAYYSKIKPFAERVPLKPVEAERQYQQDINRAYRDLGKEGGSQGVTEPSQSNLRSSFAEVYTGLDVVVEIPEWNHKINNTAFSVIERRYQPSFGEAPKTFVVPKGAKMADEFPSPEDLNFHRSYFSKPLQELHARVKPISSQPDRDRKAILEEARKGVRRLYDSQQVRDYLILGEIHKELMEKLRTVVYQLHQPVWAFSSLPIAYAFVAFTKPELPKLPLPEPSREMNLINLDLCDDHLKKKRATLAGRSMLLSCYSKVNLSHNNLVYPTGVFSEFLTDLTLTNNKMTSLGFLQDIWTRLVSLDVSSNEIEELFPLGVKDNTTLETLNISRNGIKDMALLARLHGLKNLDISRNNLTNLEGFTPMLLCLKGHEKLETLAASHCGLAGPWDRVLPPLETLRILKLNGNVGLVFTPYISQKSYSSRDVEHNNDKFKRAYPKLEALEGHQGCLEKQENRPFALQDLTRSSSF